MKSRVLFRWATLFVLGVLVGCGGEGGMQLAGPSEDPAVSRPGLAKMAVGAPSVHRADLTVTVTLEDGTPAAGLEVAFSRSISGRSSEYLWTGTADADGQAQIVITADAPQFWRSGATGYYLAKASDAASGEVMGNWSSIPISGGEENVIALPIGGQARVQPVAPPLTVMTRNIYLGADINRILQPADPETPIPVLVAQTWGMIQQTNLPERAKAIAREIAAARPHLVGLQEVSLYRIQTTGDFLSGNPVPATQVAQDFLAILLDELEARGLAYQAVAVSKGIDIELPMYTGQTTPMADIRMTDQEVILARADVQIGNVQTAQFQTKLPFNVGGVPMSIPRAWASVEATVDGRTIRFFTAHLEMGVAEPVQRGQAGELLQAIAATTLPVVLVGDFNSAADGSSTRTYGDLVAGGLVDVWGVANPGKNGFTGSQQESVRNVPSTINRRIDLIFARDADDFTVLKADVVGESLADRTPSGLWPSDHAGVVASLRLPRQ